MSGGEDIQPPLDHERKVIVLSERDIEAIAEKVEDRFYARVGRKVVEKLLWLIGIAATGLAVWFVGKGGLK